MAASYIWRCRILSRRGGGGGFLNAHRLWNPVILSSSPSRFSSSSPKNGQPGSGEEEDGALEGVAAPAPRVPSFRELRSTLRGGRPLEDPFAEEEGDEDLLEDGGSSNPSINTSMPSKTLFGDSVPRSKSSSSGSVSYDSFFAGAIAEESQSRPQRLSPQKGGQELSDDAFFAGGELEKKNTAGSLPPLSSSRLKKKASLLEDAAESGALSELIGGWTTTSGGGNGEEDDDERSLEELLEKGPDNRLSFLDEEQLTEPLPYPETKAGFSAVDLPLPLPTPKETQNITIGKTQNITSTNTQNIGPANTQNIASAKTQNTTSAKTQNIVSAKTPAPSPYENRKPSHASHEASIREQYNKFNETKAQKSSSTPNPFSERSPDWFPFGDTDRGSSDSRGFDTIFGKGKPASGDVDEEFSFRKLRKGGGHFEEILARAQPVEPVGKPTEDDDESFIFNSPSFMVLRESLRNLSQPSQESTPIHPPGLKSSEVEATEDWLSYLESPRSSSGSSGQTTEEGFFSQRTPVLKPKPAKKWSYEELGEKLRQHRLKAVDKEGSPLPSGFSFKELADRIAKIQATEDPRAFSPTAESYQELKESLYHLRRSTTDRGQPQTTERRKMPLRRLIIENRLAQGEKHVPLIMYKNPKFQLLEKYFSPEQLTSKEILKLEIAKLKKEFQVHDFDSGSPQVQVAILTAKINNLGRHFKENFNNKRDKHSRRGLNGMIQDRKRLLWYLRSRDWDAYCNVLTKLKLPDIIHEKMSAKFKNL